MADPGDWAFTVCSVVVLFPGAILVAYASSRLRGGRLRYESWSVAVGILLILGLLVALGSYLHNTFQIIGSDWDNYDTWDTVSGLLGVAAIICGVLVWLVHRAAAPPQKPSASKVLMATRDASNAAVGSSSQEHSNPRVSKSQSTRKQFQDSIARYEAACTALNHAIDSHERARKTLVESESLGRARLSVAKVQFEEASATVGRAIGQYELAKRAYEESKDGALRHGVEEGDAEAALNRAIAAIANRIADRKQFRLPASASHHSGDGLLPPRLGDGQPPARP